MDKPMPVADGIPYSYPGKDDVGSTGDAISGKGGRRKEQNVFITRGVPALIGAAGVGNGIVSLIYTGKWFDLRDDFRKEPVRSAAGTGSPNASLYGTSMLIWWCLTPPFTRDTR